MASRVGPLHPVFAGLWITFCVAMVVYLYAFDHNIWIDAAFGAYFGIVEGIAVLYKKYTIWQDRKVGLRDTLSEFQTFIAKMSKPGTRWYESWNALVVWFALHPSWMVARNSPETILQVVPFQLAVFGLFVGYLVFHWLVPAKKG